MKAIYIRIIGALLIITSLSLLVIFSLWMILFKIYDPNDLSITSYLPLSSNIIDFMQQDRIICLGISVYLPLLFLILYGKYIALNYFIRVS